MPESKKKEVGREIEESSLYPKGRKRRSEGNRGSVSEPERKKKQVGR
ncbi:hypothetical protein AB3U99_02890 [Niallia sp. JL1B1071]